MSFVDINRSLPRSLDVQISLSRASVEVRTDLSTLVVVLTDLGFFPGPERIRFYSTIEAVENDFAAGSEAHFAAISFFAQNPRPPTLAIGEAFQDPFPAENASAVLSEKDLIAIADVSVGHMDLMYSDDGTAPTTLQVRDLNFTGISTIEGVVEKIQEKIIAELACAVRELPGGDKTISIVTQTLGSNTVILFPVDPEGVIGSTYVGDILKLTSELGGKVFNGYDPVGIADELASIATAADVSGSFIYGWTLGASLRDSTTQTEAAAWALARTAIIALTTNDALALDPSVTDDIGSLIAETGNQRAVVLYHDNAQRYPCVSLLAYMLHVSYRLPDSTVTAKFKQLPGIETVALSETEWSILQSKQYNTYTAIGNASKTYRDGITSGLVGWYMDTVINLDNFLEDLSVNVFNVFLRNKKIPYTRAGQLLLVDACQDTGNQYTYNGTFADRRKASIEVKSGFILLPAVLVIPTPVDQASPADRASREGPPIQMIVQEAGAIHSTSINVELVQ